MAVLSCERTLTNREECLEFEYSCGYFQMDYKEYNFDIICRACLGEDIAMKSIYVGEIAYDNNIDMTDFIRRVTSLKMTEGDGLPENICLQCIEAICKAYNFAQLCISSDKTLRLQHKRQALKNIQKEIIEEETEHLKIEEQEIYSQSYEIYSVDFKPQRLANGEELTCKIDSDSERVSECKDECRDMLNADNFDSQTRTESVNSKNHKRKSYQKKYNCSNCPESFNSKEKLTRHEEVHDPNKPYKCEQCFKTFLKKAHLSIHLRCHIKSEDKKFACKVCGQQFSYSYLLKQHGFKHTSEKPFPCPKCDRGCLTAESLRRHMKTHDVNYIKKKHVCGICSKEFPYPSFLAEHMKNHTGEKPFLCSICGKGFRQSGALEYHIRSHTGFKPFTCEICNNNFMSPGVLRVHMRRHTNERPYVCDICGMSFRQSTDMKSHRRTHNGDKPVLCTVCGKRMFTTGQLTVHLRSHTGEKPFSCRTCAKAFATSSMLVKHERIHTGERPYACNVCGRAFNQSSTLKTHFKIHKKYKRKETCANKKAAVNKVLVRHEQSFLVGCDNQLVSVPIIEEIKVDLDQSDENNEDFPPPVPLV